MYGLTGLEDEGRTGETWEWRLQPHQLARVERAMLVHYFDHGHGTATGLPNRPDDPPTRDLVVDYTIAAFARWLLKGEDADAARKGLANPSMWAPDPPLYRGEYCPKGKPSVKF